MIWVAGVLWDLALPALLLLTGLSGRLRTAAWRVGQRWYFALVVYFVLLSALIFVFDLPLAFYGSFYREHLYGLSNESAAKWIVDALKSLAVTMVVGAGVLWVPFLLLAKSPRCWWLYTGLLSLPFLLLTLVVAPIWIAPLFNKFGPLEDEVLEAKILTIADRAGIDSSRVYEVDKSLETEKVNAYVTGIGGTKRIVLWDTLVAKLEDRQVLSVVAHEVGHYVLGHVAKSVLLGALLTLLTLFAIHHIAGRILRRWGPRLGVGSMADFASLPLLMLLANAISFGINPALLAYSRHIEHEADRFGLEITRDNHAAATAFVELQHHNLSIPRPGLLYEIFRASHPPIGERVDFINHYRPWATGAPLKYDELIEPPRTPLRGPRSNP